MADHTTTSPDDQYRAVTADVGYIVLGHQTQIELTGVDRAALLQNLCTNDINRLQTGEGCEAFVTSAQGKVLGHILVFCSDDSLMVETVADQADNLLPHFDKYVIREDVELRDRTQELSELLLTGPRAAEVWAAAGTRPAPRDRYRHVADEVAGQPVSIRRVPMTRAPGFLISTDSDQINSLTAALREAGAAACGRDVFEQLRVEAGWPLFGRDITPQNLPQEVDRDVQTISFEKGCYLGQETVARIDALGHVNRKLICLQFESTEVPAAGAELLANDKEVGRITSAVYSPHFQAALALGYVRREHNGPSGQLDSAMGLARVISTVDLR